MARIQKKRTLLVGMYTGAATVETVPRFLKIIKIELPYDLVTPLLTKQMKHQFKKTCVTLCLL